LVRGNNGAYWSFLRETGVTDDEIKARKYYNVDWFSERVPRFIPKPSVLYRRVVARCWEPGKADPEKLCYDVLKHVDGNKVFPKLAVYNRRQLKVMEHSSRKRDSMKKNRKALRRLDALDEQLLEESQSNEGEADEGTDETDCLVDDDGVPDANGAAGEEDAGVAEQVENVGATEQGESAGAV
jgi:hypothetical protein